VYEVVVEEAWALDPTEDNDPTTYTTIESCWAGVIRSARRAGTALADCGVGPGASAYGRRCA
jgi:hypothetical protein